MPPKKPVVIKLKATKPVDPHYADKLWDQVDAALNAVFDVPISCAPANRAKDPSRAGEDAALEAATTNILDGTRRRELQIHRRIGGSISFHAVYQAACDLCRDSPSKMLEKVRTSFERWVPLGVAAWLDPLVPLATNGGSSSTGIASAADAQSTMRLMVAAWEHHLAAFKVIVDILAYLDNSYVKINTAEGGIVAIGTTLFAAAATKGRFGTLFDAACRGFVEAVSEDRAGSLMRRSDLTSCRNLLLATGTYHARVEAPLSDDADKFYTRLGNTLDYTERVSAAEFIRRVDLELRQEDQRLRAYGHSSVRPQIEALAQERLIKAHLANFANAHMRSLVQAHDFVALAGLYRLSRLRYVRLEEVIRKAFREYVQKVAAELLGAPPEVESSLIELLIAHNATCNEVIRRCFVIGSTGVDAFSTAKKDAFESALRPKQAKAAELLAKYLDHILREGATAIQAPIATSSAAGGGSAGRGDPDAEGDDAGTTGGVGSSAGAADASGLSTVELIDAALVEGMKLFNYIPSKDIFEAFYTRYFGKRLVLQRTVGLEHERVVIEQLRAVCGPSVALKLNGMLKDIDLSRDIQTLMKQTRFVRLTGGDADDAKPPANGAAANGSFTRRESTMGEPALSEIGPYQSSLAHVDFDGAEQLPLTTSNADQVNLTPCGFDFNILVLTEGFWPTYAVTSPALPANIQRQMELFKVFYLSKHSGRKLTWQHALAHCVVRAKYTKSRKEFVVSFLQALILLEFNDRDSMTYKEILDKLALEQSEEMTCAIIGLYAGNAKVLQRDKAENPAPLPPPKKSGEPRIVVRNEDVIKYNGKFVHRLMKIRVNQVQLKETKEEIQDTTEKVLSERAYVVDAAIVRFMKSRKEAKHNELVSEVLGMLRFAAQPQDIKKRVETLIEREYLERDTADNALYRYLA
jgi:cullin-4